MASDDAYTDRLSDYLDDEDLGSSERQEIETHLAVCEHCRAVLAELRDVSDLGRQLTDSVPQSDLWPGVAERLNAPQVLPFVARAPRRFSFTLPQLVAAGLALMVLSGGLVWVARLGDPRTSLPPVVAHIEPDPGEQLLSPVALVDPTYDQAVADLEKVLEAGRGRLDPETVRILEDNLDTIDQAIEQSRKALRADPANVYLNNHFVASRNRKLALLRRASALAMASDISGGS
jgi:tetratricopeptide (TPR) repeat protein